jgi:single-strand DNA-binding protein
MNSITIAGQLGRDIEIRHMPNGDPVGSFSVADSQGKDKPTIWWRCQLFGKRAESLAQYLTKGQSVTVSGTITEREYQKDGAPVKAMEIRVNDIALQGGRRDSEPQQHAPQRQQAPARPAPSRPPQRPQAAAAPRQSSGFDDMDDGDIPFRDPLAYRGVHLAV